MTSLNLLLSADNLRIERGDRVLIRDFSLTLHAGEVCYLQGANGVGKTTLLETLAGLQAPAAGHIERAALHWIGHKNALHPALTPLENLQDWADYHGADRQAIPPLLKALQSKNRPTRTLSTGQKRRVALARLQLLKRRLWLLDEPFAGLDAASVSMIGDWILQHQQAGGAVLLTSHQALPLQGFRTVFL
jgi:heme exporter protein A